MIIEVCPEPNEHGKYRWTIYKQYQNDADILFNGFESTFEKAYLIAYAEYSNNCT